MKSYESALPLWNIRGKTVLVRADLNVPRNPDGSIFNDFRLLQLLPTLEMIQRKGAKITLITHCGQPKNNEATLSTKPFIEWFEEHGFKPTFCPTFEKDSFKENNKKSDLFLFENLRFFKEETDNDKQFAQKLSKLGAYFIQDAFGVLHRKHASITHLPSFFDSNKRTIGLLVEKELKQLNQLIASPKKPFVLILGGNKVETKLPLINSLLDKVNAILLCPALVFTFLKAQGKHVGKSLVNDDLLEEAKNILEKAQAKNIDIIFPIDYQITRNSFEKPFPLEVSQRIGKDMTGIAIGPKTAELYKHCILQAHTIFFNGMSGNKIYPESLEGIKSIFNALQQTAAYKIITGGDSVALAQSLGYTEKLAQFSTGGGSTLTYLSGNALVGLLALS